MTVEVDIKVLGDEAALRLLEQAETGAADLRNVWRIIDKSLHVFFRRQFETGGAAGGVKWRPLLPRTQRYRPRPGGNRGGVNRPLWDTGRLKASLQSPGPESVRVFQRLRYERGSQVPYSLYHQTGQGVPARPIIPDPWPAYKVRAWMRIVEAHLLDMGDAGPEASPAGA